MKIHLVRHGQTIWHNENRYAGITDINLDRVGLRQAQDLIGWANKQQISKILSSDLTRAINTALPTALTLGLEIEMDPRFREVNFGKVEGLNPDQFFQEFPNVFREFQNSPAETFLPGGESGMTAVNRAEMGIFDLFRRNHESEIAIFSHGTLIRLLLCRSLGFSTNDYRRIFPKFENTSIATIEISPVFPELEIKGNFSLINLSFI